MTDPPHPVARLLLALLRRALPPDWADDIVRDLEEAHGRRRAAGPSLPAHLWLAGQVAHFTLRFGVERLRGGGRPVWAVGAGSLRRDLIHALRSLRAHPVFFASVVGTLAVGIGANTAMFSVVRTVILEPLPHPGSERWVVLEPTPWTPAGVVQELDAAAAGFDALAGLYPRTFAVTGGERPEEVEGAVVTPDLLPTLGAETALGRLFLEADAAPGAPAVVLLGHGSWQRLFGGSPDVLGRTLRIDGRPREVVGVLEPGFRARTPRSEDPQLWIPAAMDGLGADAEGVPWALPMARLAAGAPIERAQAELEAALRRYESRTAAPADEPVRRVGWTRLEDHLTEKVRPALLVLQAAVGLVLLLACVNVANLLLVRFGARRREVAIRTALGASRGRILRQLLTESVLLALVGGAAGLLLAVGFLELAVALAPPDVPRIGEVGLDGPVLLVTLAVAVGTGLLFGVAPALAATADFPERGLREGSRTATASRGSYRFSQGLVVAEVTLTLVLVVAAGLLLRSFSTLTSQEPGFRAEGVLALPLNVPEHRFVSVPELEAHAARLLGGLEAAAGVASVGVTNRLPIQRSGTTREILVEGESESRTTHYGVVSPGYFEVLEIPLVQGRLLREGDRREAPRVAVIDRSMARTVWPDGEALGKHFRFPDQERWTTVVGVVGDIRGSGLARAPEPGFYVPYRQRPDNAVELAVGRHLQVLARMEPGAPDPASTLRRTIHEVDPLQPVAGLVTLESVLSREVAPQRFRALLLGLFATLALGLAVAGLYGVVSHLLSERVHELGIRRALGATGGDVVGRVLGWGLRLTAVGVALGFGAVLLLNRWLASLLFGVGPTDPATIVAAVATIVAVTLGACLVPALRAARVDALLALRME